MQKFLNALRDRILLFDGAMGTGESKMCTVPLPLVERFGECDSLQFEITDGGLVTVGPAIDREAVRSGAWYARVVRGTHEWCVVRTAQREAFTMPRRFWRDNIN